MRHLRGNESALVKHARDLAKGGPFTETLEALCEAIEDLEQRRHKVINDTLDIVYSYKYGEYSAVSDDSPENSVEVQRAKAVESTVEGIMKDLRELRKRELSSGDPLK
jgi:hypothetical protein